MSKLPAIPDFTDDVQSIGNALRAVKEAIETLAGQRGIKSLGAPQVYVQDRAPVRRNQADLSVGDLWITASPVTVSFWDGGTWVLIP